MRRTLIVLLLLATPAVARADAADDFVNRWLAQFKVPGVVVAVIKDGHAVKMQAYGLANRENGTPMEVDHVLKIGSVSKQFFATAIVLLVRDGRLGLDNSIGQYFDDLPLAWKPITIRHLLSHTAGLVRESPVFDPLKSVPDIDIIRGAYRVPLLSAPGEKYAYSNLGYYILAEVIARVARKPWFDYINEVVFTPAGLQPMFTTNMSAVTMLTPGYGGNDNSERVAPWVALRPSGAFMTAMRNLVAWDGVLQTDRVLTAAERQLMTTGVLLNNGTAAPYGFGWHVEQFRNHRYIWHGGGLPGFSSNYARFPDDRLTIITLSNGDDSDMGALTANLALIYLPN